MEMIDFTNDTAIIEATTTKKATKEKAALDIDALLASVAVTEEIE